MRSDRQPEEIQKNNWRVSVKPMRKTDLNDYHHHATETSYSLHHRGYIESFCVRAGSDGACSLDLRWRNRNSIAKKEKKGSTKLR